MKTLLHTGYYIYKTTITILCVGTFPVIEMKQSPFQIFRKFLYFPSFPLVPVVEGTVVICVVVRCVVVSSGVVVRTVVVRSVVVGSTIVVGLAVVAVVVASAFTVVTVVI